METVYPLVQRLMPDGTVVLEERGKVADTVEALRAYDPRLSLCRNMKLARWEIWRSNEDGSQGRVGTSTDEFLPDPQVLVADLYAHDTWKGYDPVAELDKREAARDRAVEAELEEMAGASADRMHYEFIDEFSAHMPAARPISLAPNGHRERARPA